MDMADKSMAETSLRETASGDSRTGLEVAVIGMACRFPGAKNSAEFWENLKNGVESIASFSHQELAESGIAPQIPEDPDYISARGFLEDTRYFDAAFFGYTPLEANMMNPQIRFFHECAWEALENAGYNPDTYDGLIGLFAGLTPSLKWDAGIFLKSSSSSEFFTAHNMNSNYFCALISYKLNLRGPAVTVQTACSTSLAAVHTACRTILTGECDMALAGGVTISLPSKTGYFYQEGMNLSPDGHCRAFDARARGTISGDGVGVAALKLLADAVEDGDHIYAVIKGSAINNDGNRKVGYTAPSVEGQKDVIKSVFQVAEIDPETITYVETHGTGTPLGDPIEIEALKLAFNTDKRGYCRIGSVKTNVGHLDSAAGAAAFIKTVLALMHKQIPPSLHFESPNPGIDFEHSPFVVNTGLTGWQCGGFPRRAGVSSFGIGGTNAHVILEEWPDRTGRGGPLCPPPASPTSRQYRLILLSARTGTALDKMTENLVTYLKQSIANPGNPIDLADLAYTLQVGRKHFEHRRMLVCSSIDEAAQLLENEGEKRSPQKGNKHVVFLFPGQGAQYVDMGLELYRTEPVFREEMDRCFEILKPLMSYDIKEILYRSDRSDRSDLSDIHRTEITQPLIFIFEYAMARLLMHWGLQPHAMIGHSTGEYTAACLAGVFSLEDALKTVALMGKLMQRLPTGSAVMDPVLEPFERHLAGITLDKPQIPFISNLTGAWITAEEAVNPVYWARRLRDAGRFFDGLTGLLKDSDSLYVEVGPGRVLTDYVAQHPDGKPDRLAVNLVRHPKEQVSDRRYLLNKIGELWLYGGTIDWKVFNADAQKQRIPLPTYPFAREAYSIDFNLPVDCKTIF